MEAEHPHLADPLRRLVQDHAMIGHLVGALQPTSPPPPRRTCSQHLDGLAAIMESHLGFEERTLVALLDRLELDATVADVFGPL